MTTQAKTEARRGDGQATLGAIGSLAERARHVQDAVAANPDLLRSLPVREQILQTGRALLALVLLDATITTVRPLDNRLLVRRAESVGQSKGGILLPAKAQKLSMKGLVLAVGPGQLDTQTGQRQPVAAVDPRTGSLVPVALGDTILFTKHAGFLGKLDDHEEILLIDGRDVLAVVDPQAVS